MPVPKKNIVTDIVKMGVKKAAAKKTAAKVIKKERKSARATMPNAVDRSGQNVKVVSGKNMARVLTDEANRGTVRVYRKADAKVEKRALKVANKNKKSR